MLQRAGLPAVGIAASAAALLLASFEVQGKEMPPWVFWPLVAFLACVLGLSGYVVLHGLVWTRAKAFINSHEFRSPIVPRNRPNPSQWLLDIATGDTGNPGAQIAITDATINAKTLETISPYIVVTCYLFNGTVHDVNFARLTGRISYYGQQIESAPEIIEGDGFWLRGHTARVRIKQWLPEKVAEAARTLGGNQIPEAFDISGLAIEIRLRLSNDSSAGRLALKPRLLRRED